MQGLSNSITVINCIWSKTIHCDVVRIVLAVKRCCTISALLSVQPSKAGGFSRTNNTEQNEQMDGWTRYGEEGSIQLLWWKIPLHVSIKALWRNCWARRQGDPIDTVSVDFLKPFDTMPHKRLLKKWSRWHGRIFPFVISDWWIENKGWKGVLASLGRGMLVVASPSPRRMESKETIRNSV